MMRALRTHWRAGGMIVSVLLAVVALWLSNSVHIQAATATVTTCLESGPSSLRDAIASAADGNVIEFSSGLACPDEAPILITHDPLAIRTNLTIDGSGHGITISGSNAARLFEVDGGVHVTLHALTFSNGAGMFGGAIDNNGGVVTVTNSTFVDSAASFEGGGIYNNNGTVSVTNCTFADNRANQGGGGIFNNGGVVSVTNTTFADNVAGQGAGIDNRASVTLTNTLIAHSTGGALHGDASGSNNLIEDAASGGLIDGVRGNRVGHPALLGSLGASPTPTGPRTLPLLPGSPAIDTGASSADTPTTDQRGLPRVGPPDIGAFESQGLTLTIAEGTDQSTPVGALFARPLTVRVSSDTGEPVQGGQVTFTPPPVGPTALIVGNPAPIGQDAIARVAATANGVAGPYAVTASAAGAASLSFRLNNRPVTLTLSPGALPNGVGNEFYNQRFSASGGMAPYRFMVTAGSLPTGLTLSTTGTLSGTPTVARTVTFTIQAIDVHGVSGSQSYTLAIGAPTIRLSPTMLPGGTRGGPYPSTTFTATGGSGPYTFSIAIGSLPLGMYLSANGTLSGTPGTTGLFSITVQVKDANGFIGSQSYTFVITDAPVTPP